MRLIRPDVSANVPRGTIRRIWRHPLDSVHYQAVVARFKTQMRVPFKPENCAIERGEFDQLDLTRGAPGTRAPGTTETSLAARIKVGAVMRSVQVRSAAQPGDVIFCGDPHTKMADAPESLLVLDVRPERLRMIGDEDALEEIARWWTGECRGDATDAAQWRGIAYAELTKFLRRQNFGRWLRSEEHRESQASGVTPRHLFTLDWIRLYGYTSWLLNPWVWVFKIEMVPMRPAVLVRRLEEERRSA